MGDFVHENLDTEGPLNALYKAFLQVSVKGIKGLIHHSDRGGQYCSALYTKTLKMKEILISTTQDGSPYDNAIAERVNGIIKREWINEETFYDIKQVRERIEQIVQIYNTQRIHYSIGLRTPDSVYREGTGEYEFNMY